MKKSNLTDYPNYRVSKRGKIIRLSDGKVIKCYLNHRFNRYYCWLYDSKNIRVKVYRYRLVAMAWIPNPENKPEVCHIDIIIQPMIIIRIYIGELIKRIWNKCQEMGEVLEIKV